ncbi:excinuclease ABC subunit C [Enterococcus faecalis]|nr:excinuclease ABC subunit C [Enterococcus faecalis]MDN3109501.1 excinuclease ABC subunit C [Enterococcus faecalis]MEB8141068.1 excinuclease ABC subunit C [Enterococcus faecalis]TBH14496.1 excinuclease ABC subunit C [Enterococcus faecalis]
MKTSDYQDTVSKEDNNTTSIVYVQRSYLVRKISSNCEKYKCLLFKKIYTIQKHK